jgi:hypothetical protein
MLTHSIMKKLFKKYISLVFLLMGVSCNLDQLQNPNEVTPTSADPAYILNGIRLGVRDAFFESTKPTQQLMRMYAAINGKVYTQQFGVTAFDQLWINIFQEVLINCQTVLTKVDGVAGLEAVAAEAKLSQAYVTMLAVDLFGDIPYTETLQGGKNFNPGLDKGSDVYPKALAAVNSAMNDIAKSTSSSRTYGVSFDQLTRIANTLKLKYYLNTRLVDGATAKTEINNLTADTTKTPMISWTGGWTFEYGSNLSAPDTRHPWYSGNYTQGASDYMSNSYMFDMYYSGDPRMRYYFYRQQTSPTTDVNAAPCVGNSLAQKPWMDQNGAFCQVAAGYWGRDHLNDDGIGPDTKGRTAWGLYPAGGRFDASQNEPTALGQGAGGAGIMPIFMGSYSYFMLAEAALTLGTNGDPKALTLKGVEASLRYVQAFASRDAEVASGKGTSRLMTETTIQNYLNTISTNYDNSTDKLDFVIHQFWLAAFGNGNELYNAYRRTNGSPKNLQRAYKTADPGDFYRSLIYPNVYLSRNSTAPGQKPDGKQVFWDTNPAGNAFMY